MNSRPSHSGARIVGANAPDAIESVARALLSGGVAVFPTDTVYGIAAHPAFPQALERIYAIKGRRPDKPVAFLASGADVPAGRCYAMPPAAEALARSFWPGALTLVLDGPDGAEGFRVPALPLAVDIIAACGGLLRVTSANFSGEPAPGDFADIPQAFLDRCDIAVDGGRCPGGTASAVVRVARGAAPEILRAGATEISRAVGSHATAGN